MLSSACNNADVSKSEHDVRIKQAAYLMVHASQLCSIQHKHGFHHISQTVVLMRPMLSVALHIASDTGWCSVYRLSAAKLLLSRSEWVISTSECFREASYLWCMLASSGALVSQHASLCLEYCTVHFSYHACQSHCFCLAMGHTVQNLISSLVLLIFLET